MLLAEAGVACFFSLDFKVSVTVTGLNLNSP